MLDITATDWKAIGEVYPTSRLLSTLTVAGVHLHLEAREITPGDMQELVDFPEDYDHLSGLNGDSPFTTAEIDGRHYVLFAIPYAR